MAPLTLAEHSLVLPADGVLHVFSRRNLHDLKGKQVDRLHERLTPYLRGTLEEDDLVRAVPASQAAAIQTYLAGLREAGALGDQAGTDPPALMSDLAPLNALDPHRTWIRFRVGIRTVEVSIDGAEALGPGTGAVRVCFVTRAEARRVLWSLGQGEAESGQTTYVVVEDGDGSLPAQEVETRAAYARWLLRNELDVLPERDRFRLFQLDAATGDLRRLAETEGRGTPHLRTLPEQLRVVQATKVDQVPLVVVSAAHPLVGGRITAFGVSSGAVRRQCLRTLVARVLLRPGSSAVPPVAMVGRMGEPQRCDSPAPAYWERPARLEIAACRLELLLQLAGRWAERRALESGVAWEPADLLHVAASHSAAAYLQEVLRTRLSELPGELACTGDGLFLFRSEVHRGRSFVRPHALAEVLLRTAWDVFYKGLEVPGGPTRALPVCSALEFEESGDLRRILRDRIAGMRRHGGDVWVREGRLRCWGVSAWVGDLDDAARVGGAA
jgi:hypothetical protein